jgi:hypothetical protein
MREWVNLLSIAATLYLGVVAFGNAASAFRMMEATIYEGKPDGLGCDIEHVHVVYEHLSGVKVVPDAFIVDGGAFRGAVERARAAAAEIVVLDIENVPARPWATLAGVVNLFKRELPGRRLGFYGHVPPLGYWNVVGNRPVKRSTEEDKEIETLVRSVDATFPSLYVHYDDLDGWIKYAKEVLRVARNYGKPVYPFIWPQYHDGNKELGRTFVDTNMWKAVLETVIAEADGAVLWGGWRDREGRRMRWDPDADWWRVTKQVVAQHVRDFGCDDER